MWVPTQATLRRDLHDCCDGGFRIWNRIFAGGKFSGIRGRILPYFTAYKNFATPRPFYRNA